MTTLELAHRIAHAVWTAKLNIAEFPSVDLMRDPGTQAVLQVLHDTGHWFCRMEVGLKGETVDVALEYVQPDLFCGRTPEPCGGDATDQGSER